MKKIYLFDSWSFGYKFFSYYVPYLKNNGYEVVFFHFDKIQSPCLLREKSAELVEYGKLVQSQIKSIDLSDISDLTEYFSDIGYPDYFLHLSVSHLENRLITSAILGKDVDNVYVQHGNIFDSLGASKTIKAQSKWRVIFSRTFPWKIVKILLLFKKMFQMISFKEWIKLVYSWLSGPRKFIWLPGKHSSLRMDIGFSFSDAEASALSDIYGISRSKITTICNPEVFKLNDRANLLSDYKNVVFIDQAFVETDVLSYEQQVKDFYICKEVALLNNLSFYVRPHPRCVASKYKEESLLFRNDCLEKMLLDNNIYISYNSSLMKTLAQLGCQVIHYSPDNGFRSESIFLEPEFKKYVNNVHVCKSKLELNEAINSILKLDVNIMGLISDPGLEVIQCLESNK